MCVSKVHKNTHKGGREREPWEEEVQDTGRETIHAAQPQTLQIKSLIAFLVWFYVTQRLTQTAQKDLSTLAVGLSLSIFKLPPPWLSDHLTYFPLDLLTTTPARLSKRLIESWSDARQQDPSKHDQIKNLSADSRFSVPSAGFCPLHHYEEEADYHINTAERPLYQAHVLHSLRMCAKLLMRHVIEVLPM